MTSDRTPTGDTDPLDMLADALRSQTPPPDDAARDAAIRAAAEAFAAQTASSQKNATPAQGSAAGPRPIHNRPRFGAGIWMKGRIMLNTLTAPRTLMGTTALATLALAVIVTQTMDGPPALSPKPLEVTETGETRSGLREQTQGTPARSRAAADSMAVSPAPVMTDTATRSLIGSAPPPASAVSPDAGPQTRQAPQVEQALGAHLSDQLFLAEPEVAFPTEINRESNTESFANADTNPLKRTSDAPVSTFSVDVDTAAYAYVRSALNGGSLPPRDAVRIEEMINYFDYDYPMPTDAQTPFATAISVQPTPWNPGTQLLHVGIQGYDIAPENRPALNLVFLIDTSGSMNNPDKLPLLIQSFRLLLDTLGEDDSIAIVTYAGSAGMALPPTAATDRATILNALTQLSAGGSTAGQQGLQQAYALADTMRDDGEVSRVILATDGDFNVGISDPEALTDYIADRRDSGTYLSVLGFGRGNYQDATLQALAQNGNGTAAYIDTLAEAQKVLVEDVAGSLFPIAGDVKIQIEFNPAQISEYRLIGYETRALAREDFNNDAVDAGDIGAAHQVTALYEITPTGSAAERVDSLRYGAADTEPGAETSDELAFVKLRYKLPGEDTSRLVETAVTADRADIDPVETRFAAAVASFGGLLRGDTSLMGWTYDDARALAAEARGADPYGYRSELLGLIRIAGALDR